TLCVAFSYSFITGQDATLRYPHSFPTRRSSDLLSRADGAGELDRRHVRSPPGPVDGEEAQAGAGNAEQVAVGVGHQLVGLLGGGDRKSTRLNSSHVKISYAVFCLKKKIQPKEQ